MPDEPDIPYFCHYYQAECPFNDNDRDCLACIDEDLYSLDNDAKCRRIIMEIGI